MAAAGRSQAGAGSPLQSPEKAPKGVRGYMGQGDGKKAPLLGLWRAALRRWRRLATADLSRPEQT